MDSEHRLLKKISNPQTTRMKVEWGHIGLRGRESRTKRQETCRFFHIRFECLH
jgi:hypothetical protein